MTDRLTIATWNVNSIRSRLDHLTRFVAEHSPDVLCLQETRCPDGSFPLAAVQALGYPYISLNGKNGYHGVATASRRPFSAVLSECFADIDEPRHLATTVEYAGGPISIHNLYIPAGGDVPDPAVNPRFASKLAFLDALALWSASTGPAGRAVVVGDLNVAPLPDDVWSHKQLLDVVSHTPAETKRLDAVVAAGGWVDAVRAHFPPPQPVFTWWSYRARDWRAANRGRRLDHVWLTGDLGPHIDSVAVVDATRGWEKPSDHVPIVTTLVG